MAEVVAGAGEAEARAGAVEVAEAVVAREEARLRR